MARGKVTVFMGFVSAETVISVYVLAITLTLLDTFPTLVTMMTLVGDMNSIM